MRELWREMSRYRQILLAAMAAMILGFGIATPIVCSISGIEYGDTLLRFREEGGTAYYEGTVDGEAAAFSVSPDGTVEYRWGEYQYGPYQMVEDPSAAPEDFRMTGIEIRQGDQVLFRGGFQPNSALPLYQENGEPLWDLGISVTMSGGRVVEAGEDGREIGLREQHEPGPAALARLALAPELTHRGSVGRYLLITLLALFNIFQICCPSFFFRLSLIGRVRNVEQAEPSDFYIAMEKLEWLILAGACLFLYGMNLQAIS